MEFIVQLVLVLLMLSVSVVKVYDMIANCVLWDFRHGANLNKEFRKQLKLGEKQAAEYYFSIEHDPMHYFEYLMSQTQIAPIRWIVRVFYKWPTLLIVNCLILGLVTDPFIQMISAVSVFILISSYIIHEFVARERCGVLSLFRNDSLINFEDEERCAKLDDDNHRILVWAVKGICALVSCSVLLKTFHNLSHTHFICADTVNIFHWVILVLNPISSIGFGDNNIKPDDALGYAAWFSSSAVFYYFAVFELAWEARLMKGLKLHNLILYRQ